MSATGTNTNTAAAILAKLIYSPEYVGEVETELQPFMFGSSLMTEIADKVYQGFETKKYYNIHQFRDEYPEIAEAWLQKPASAQQLPTLTALIQDTWQKNEVAKIYTEAAQIARSNYLEAQSYVESNIELIRHNTASSETKLQDIKGSMDFAYRMLEAAKTGQVSGINTGFKELNTMIAGWQQKTINIIAARPGLGKTTLSMQTAIAAAKSGHEVIYFTAGDSGNEMIYLAMACMLADIDKGRVRKGLLSDEDKKKLNRGYEELSSLPIIIKDNGQFNGRVSGIKSLVRKKAMFWEKPGLVIVDYLQQIAPDQSTRNRVDDIRIVSSEMQQLCKQIESPMILVSQLSRESEKEGRVPRSSDLRGSGDIEQDADTILMLYREADGRPLGVITKDRFAGGGNLAIPFDWLPDIGRYKTIWDRDMPIFAAKPESILITKKGNIDEEDLPF
jgi:replicative DNA helicase